MGLQFEGWHRKVPIRGSGTHGVLGREGGRSAQMVEFGKTTRPGYSSMGGRVSPEELNLLNVLVPPKVGST